MGREGLGIDRDELLCVVETIGTVDVMFFSNGYVTLLSTVP